MAVVVVLLKAVGVFVGVERCPEAERCVRVIPSQLCEVAQSAGNGAELVAVVDVENREVWLQDLDDVL